MKTKNVLCGLAIAVVLQLGMLAGSAQTNIYLYTGSETNITLPPGTYIITAYGAPGDGYENAGGGYGAEMSAEFNFSMSTNLTLLVGGGAGPAIGNSSYGDDGGGGGGSFVVEGNTPLVIAGGGGGGGSNSDPGGNGNVSTHGRAPQQDYGPGYGGAGASGGIGGNGSYGSGGGGGGGGFLGNGGDGGGGSYGGDNIYTNGGGGGFSFQNGGGGGIANGNGGGNGGYGGGGSGGGYSGFPLLPGGGGGGGGYTGGYGGDFDGKGGGGGYSIIDSSAITNLVEDNGDIYSPDDLYNGEIIITAVPTPLVVTNSADSGPGTLRSAITNAASGAVITFDPGLSGATITLSNTLTINTNLTIDASALPGGLQINGNGSVEIFNVASTTITVFLNSLTITNGYGSESGGGINNVGVLTLNQCTLSGNGATYVGGGGILNEGTLTLNQCTLSGNIAGNYYGVAEGKGGGIYNIDLLTLNQCTLSGNSAYTGGGIYNNFESTLTLNQCTLSGNSATGNVDHDGGGGGIYNGDLGTLALTNTIVTGNSSFYGGGIYNDYGVLTYGGSNLVQSVDNYEGTIAGPTPLTNAPNLAPLGNYGGPTQTMPPLPGSPAIGAGSVAANTFSTDQRGYPRTQNGLIDLGAVELQSPAASPPVLENITLPAGGGNGLQFTFTNAPAADFTVLTATDVSLALTNWTVLGEVQQVAPGQYQFTDPQAATNMARFYRVQSP